MKQIVGPKGVTEVRRKFMATERPRRSAAEQAKLQKAAAERTLEIQRQREGDKQGAHTNVMATNDDHVGLAAHDPPKPKAMSALKTDQAETTGDPHVRRVPLKTPGKGTTDLVTISPKGAQPMGGAPAGPSMPERAADAVRAAGKKKGGGRKKKAATAT